MNQTRQPAGVPVGGQFAAHARAEGDIALDEPEAPATGHFEAARSLTWAADRLRHRTGILAFTAAMRAHDAERAVLQWKDGAAYDGGSRLGLSALLDGDGEEIELDPEDVTELEGYVEDFDFDDVRIYFDSDHEDFDKFTCTLGEPLGDSALVAERTISDITALRTQLDNLEFDVAADAIRDIVRAQYPDATEVWFDRYDVGGSETLHPVAVQGADDDLWSFDAEATSDEPTIRDRIVTVASGLIAARKRMVHERHPEWDRYSLVL